LATHLPENVASASKITGFGYTSFEKLFYAPFGYTPPGRCRPILRGYTFSADKVEKFSLTRLPGN